MSKELKVYKVFEFYPKEYVQMITNRVVIGVSIECIEELNKYSSNNDVNTSGFSIDQWLDFIGEHFVTNGWFLKKVKEYFHDIPVVCSMKREQQMDLLTQCELLLDNLYNTVTESNLKRKCRYLNFLKEFKDSDYALFLSIIETIRSAMEEYFDEYSDNNPAFECFNMETGEIEEKCHDE